MPGVRTSMRKIREVLRLRASGLTVAAIARSLGIASGTVWTYATRLQAAGLAWPLPSDLDDTALEQLVYPPPAPSRVRRPEPDWPAVHRELKRPGVTLLLVWEEYRATHPDGYGYSRFCQLYRVWAGKLPVTMRQHHLAGEKLFVDYAGQTVGVIDPATGAVREAQIFVAVMGASNFTYAEATWTQSLTDWIGAHVRAFAFLGGVPHVVVPDNLKAAIVRACLYEPAATQTFADMAGHYGTAIVPARPASITTSGLTITATVSRSRWRRPRSMCASPPPPSRPFTRASGSPATSAATSAATARSSSTCRRPTAATPTVRPSACAATPPGSAPTRRCWSMPCSPAAIPNKRSDPPVVSSA